MEIPLLVEKPFLPHIVVMCLIAIFIFSDEIQKNKDRNQFLRFLFLWIVLFFGLMWCSNAFFFDQFGKGSVLTAIFSGITGFAFLGFGLDRYPRVYMMFLVLLCGISIFYAAYFDAWYHLFYIPFGIISSCVSFLLVGPRI